MLFIIKQHNMVILNIPSRKSTGTSQIKSLQIKNPLFKVFLEGLRGIYEIKYAKPYNYYSYLFAALGAFLFTQYILKLRLNVTPNLPRNSIKGHNLISSFHPIFTKSEDKILFTGNKVDWPTDYQPHLLTTIGMKRLIRCTTSIGKAILKSSSFIML